MTKLERKIEVNVSYELSAAEQEDIRTRVRQCYNQVVTENTTGSVRFEPYDLFFMLALHHKTGRFDAAVMKLSECAFLDGVPVEIPSEHMYTASFDFLAGLQSSVRQELLNKKNEPAVRFIHDELSFIFDHLTKVLMEQMEKRP